MQIRMHTLPAYAVCRQPSCTTEVCSDENRAPDLNRIQADAALGDSPLWFGGCISYLRDLSRLISFKNGDCQRSLMLQMTFYPSGRMLRNWLTARMLGGLWVFFMRLLHSSVCEVHFSSSGTLRWRNPSLPVTSPGNGAHNTQNGSWKFF